MTRLAPARRTHRAPPAHRTRGAAPRVPVARPAPPRAPHDRRRLGPTRPVREGGAALVLALVMLVATSVLAFSTLSGTRLSETMASNAQNKAIAFEAAESGIETVWADGDAVLAVLATSTGGGPPPPETPAVPGLADAYDQSRGTGADEALVLDLGGALTVQYCGEVASRTGSEMNANLADPGVPVSYVFDVVSDVEGGLGSRVDVRARHVQRGAVTGPRSGRAGACPPP